MIRWARNLKELSKMFDCRPTYAKVPIQRPNKSQRARHSNEVMSNLKKPAHLPDICATSSTFRGGLSESWKMSASGMWTDIATLADAEAFNFNMGKSGILKTDDHG